MIERDELAAWLRLLETPRFGRDSARRLLSALGSPQAVFEARLGVLREVVGAAAAAALAQTPPNLADLIESTWQWLAAGERRAVLTLADADYPAALLETADPPLLLYVQGRVELLAATSVAVVGSRNPTAQGIENARSFARHLSQARVTVVSGLALGIDGAAHWGALDGPGGTIAVVATGLDVVYPKRHRDLERRIATDGLMVSEYSLATPPLAAHFPQRNRVIAGLSRGTLVVEAATQSGSLITARLAAECGREVFAVPGSIHAPQSRGCHALLKQGAKLVESALDILEDLRLSAPAPAPEAEPERVDPLLQALGYDPVTLDALAERTGVAPAELNVRLLELELEGQVARLPGQQFQRTARG